MTLPVVWIPEANEDLLEARAWYDNIRPELGQRFALAVEATLRQSRNIQCNSRLSTGAVDALECGASLYSR
ncbi:MAG: hypothetical protein DMG93_12140 [Acidobacteria bacterium]|nr:MAG: hypothetical protein DMG93_12140 [Acidobacteriota bacterium]